MTVTFRAAALVAHLMPESAPVPTADDLAGLAPGWFVKVSGVLEEKQVGDPKGERIWVEVTRVVGGQVQGTVASHPIALPLKHGDLVAFGKGDVFQVQAPGVWVDGRLVREEDLRKAGWMPQAERGFPREVVMDMLRGKDAIFMAFVLDQGKVPEYHAFLKRFEAEPGLAEALAEQREEMVKEMDAILVAQGSPLPAPNAEGGQP